MAPYLSITPSRMRSINQTAVMEYIRVNKGASRAVIANELGLSLPSVVRIIDDLIEKSFVRFSGEYENSGGRKRPLVEFDTESNISVGIEVGVESVAGRVTDLGGRTLKSGEVAYEPGNPAQALEAVLAAIAPLYQAARDSGKMFRGISIAVPGVTDHRSGQVLNAPAMNWRNVPLQALVEQEYPAVVTVENDSNIAALAEMWYGAGDGANNLALIQLRQGLGVGLIVDGAVYRGPQNAAGELGHMVFLPADFRTEHQDYGPVEQAIAGYGLVHQAKQILGSRLSEAERGQLTYEVVFEEYFAGAQWARPIIENFVDTLAMVVTVVSSVMDPEKIVLGGELMGPAQPLLEEVRAKLYRGTVLEQSHIGPMASFLGGAVALMHREMDYSVLKAAH